MNFKVLIKTISILSFTLATLLLVILVLTGGSVGNYWAALWQPESEVKKIAEQAYLLYIINFITLIILEVMNKDEESK